MQIFKFLPLVSLSSRRFGWTVPSRPRSSKSINLQQQCSGFTSYTSKLGLMLSSLLWNGHSAFAAEIFASTDADGQTKWSTQALDSSYRKALSLPSNSVPVVAVKSLVKPSIQQAILQQRGLLIRPLVDTVSRLHNVDSDLVMALIEIESGFNPQAISPKGARGLMQLMPATASRYGMRDAKELLDPARNLDIGVRHLKDLLAAHNGHGHLPWLRTTRANTQLPNTANASRVTTKPCCTSQRCCPPLRAKLL